MAPVKVLKEVPIKVLQETPIDDSEFSGLKVLDEQPIADDDPYAGQTIPARKPVGFWDSATDLRKIPGDIAGGISGLANLASSLGKDMQQNMGAGPLALPLTIAQRSARNIGTYSAPELIYKTGKMASSLIPVVGPSLYDAGLKKLQSVTNTAPFDFQPSDEEMGDEARSNAVLTTLGALGAKGVTGRIGAKRANAANEAEALADPSIQAASQFAEDKNWIPKSVEELGVYDKNAKEAMRRAQDRAGLSSSLGEELGMPQGKSNREIESALDLEKKAPDLYETNIFRGGDEIDIYSPGSVAKFQGEANPNATVRDVHAKADKASAQLMESRANIAQELTKAQQEINAKIPDLAGHVRGVSTETIAPKLQDLRTLIAKREKSTVTTGAAAELQAQLDNVMGDIDRILNRTDQSRPTWGAVSNRYQYGEISPVDITHMMENMNVARASARAFDESVRAGLANSTPSMNTANGATIKALTEIHEALGEALAEKSAEIISAAKKAKGSSRSLDAVRSYDPEIISRVNRTYSALQPLKEALVHFSGETSFGKAAKLPTADATGKTINIPLNTTQAVAMGGRSLLDKVLNRPTPELRLEAQLAKRENGPIQNLQRLSQMRDAPIPPIPQKMILDPNAGGGMQGALAGALASQVPQGDMLESAQAQEFMPEAIPFPRTAQAVEQLPEGYIKRMQTLVAHQTAESLGGVSPETVQAGQAVAAKATSDTVRVLTQGSPEDRKVLAHSQAAMIPGLFQQTPGAYPSELDSTILTSIDGEHHLNATLEGLYSGLVPSGLAFDQLQELNTKKLARVLFRPGQPIAPPQMAQPKPDVSELVDSFTSLQGVSREPSY